MVTVPTSEMGYQVSGRGFWDHLELEETPELIFPLSVQVYDRMRRQDAQVGSVLRAVTLPVRRTQWHIDPNGADPRVVKHVADDLNLPIVGQPLERRNRSRGRFSWAQHLQLALLMLPHGFSYFEQEYQIDSAAPGGTHLKALNWRPARSIQIANVARDGSLYSIQQWGIEKEIPVDRLVAYVNDREGGNWYGQSLLRPAYKNWLIKDDLLRTDTQTIRRNGMGVPLYTGFENEGERDPGLTKGLAMAQSWRSGELAGGAIDHDAKMELLGVSGTLPQALPSIRYHDEQIARAVLAHFLNLGTQTGSWALGSTFADFFTLSLQTVGEAVADTANQHIVEDIVDINYGEDEPAPLITFEEIGSRQMLTAQALKLLIDAGAFSIDENLEDALRQQYGMPPRDPNAPKNQPPQPQPPIPGQHDPVPEPDPTGGQ
jgi:hypothetical protein